MGLLDGFLELVAPTRCAACELPGRVLCDECVGHLPLIEAAGACPLCSAPYGHLVCTECWNSEFAFEAALALGELDGGLARAIVLHKDAGERRLGGVLGNMLAETVLGHWTGWAHVVTWIPPTRAALRRRGFDHARSIAIPVAELASVEAVDLLSRTAAVDQRSLGRAARSANSKGTFSSSMAVSGRVLLVDDVMTTGSTLDAAATALLEAGAGAVRVAVVARAW